jgi:hypothetical protein
VRIHIHHRAADFIRAVSRKTAARHRDHAATDKRFHGRTPTGTPKNIRPRIGVIALPTIRPPTSDQRLSDFSLGLA